MLRPNKPLDPKLLAILQGDDDGTGDDIDPDELFDSLAAAGGYDFSDDPEAMRMTGGGMGGEMGDQIAAGSRDLSNPPPPMKSRGGMMPDKGMMQASMRTTGMEGQQRANPVPGGVGGAPSASALRGLDRELYPPTEGDPRMAEMGGGQMPPRPNGGMASGSGAANPDQAKFAQALDDLIYQMTAGSQLRRDRVNRQNGTVAKR